MKKFFTAYNIPNCNLRIIFKAYYDKSAIWGPLDAAYLGLALGFLLRLKLNDLLMVWRGHGCCPACLWLLFWLLLNEHKVILEVGIVQSPEMRELVHIWVHLEVIVLVLIKAEAPHNLLGHEIHDQNVCILASDSYQSPLRVEVCHLSINPWHDHSGVIGEDYLVLF
jgi:hypothetical protein